MNGKRKRKEKDVDHRSPSLSEAPSSPSKTKGKVQPSTNVGDMWEGTLGYTDDSDVRLCVLHAGFVTLSDMRAAKMGSSPSPSSSKGRGKDSDPNPASTAVNDRVPRLPTSSNGKSNQQYDLAIHLLWRNVKSRFKSTKAPAEGGGFESGAWGTSHDGGVVEVGGVEWFEVRLLFTQLFSYLF